MKKDATEILETTSKSIKKTVKNAIYDIIAVIVVAAILIIALDPIEMKSVTKQTILDIIVSFIPYCLAAIILSLDYYEKGVYEGKQTSGFTAIVAEYSKIVSNLDGARLCKLGEFCVNYNKNALMNRRILALESHGFTYQYYTEKLSRMTKKQIIEEYDKEVLKLIKQVKKLSVKGINVNLLLSSQNVLDATDIGKNETLMRAKRGRSYFVGQVVSVMMLTLVGYKDLKDWSWFAVSIALFKTITIFARALTRYFDGHSDVTIRLANHLSRKTDIIKEFNAWYDENFVIKEPLKEEAKEVIN